MPQHPNPRSLRPRRRPVLRINDRVHRTAAPHLDAQGEDRAPAVGVADRNSADRYSVPGVCAALPGFSAASGVAAADHGSFRTGPTQPHFISVLWHVHRAGAGFTVEPAYRDVRHCEDAGGLFRGIGEPTVRRGESDSDVHPELFLLFFPRIFPVGYGTRAAGSARDLRPATDAAFRIVERSGG